MNEKYVYKILNIILSMNVAIRSVVYGIAILCTEERTEQVDVHRLHQMVNLDLYAYAGIMMLLEQQKIIEETSYTDPLSGYETEDGDWHLVQNDYLFKTTQGTWSKTNICITKRVHWVLSTQEQYINVRGK